MKKHNSNHPMKDAFAASLINEFKKAGITFKYDKGTFSLKSPDGNEINLQDFYVNHCQTSLSERMNQLRHCVQFYKEATDVLPESFDEARPNLHPMICPRAEDMSMRLKESATPSGDKMTLSCLGDHLVALLGYQTPTSVRKVSMTKLEEWGVTHDEAKEIAFTNLQNEAVGYSVLADGVYEFTSARILFEGELLKWKVKGDYLAMLPRIDTVIVTGSDDERGIKMMVDVAENVFKHNHHPLSPIPLRFVNGEWKDWDFPRSHSEYCSFHRVEDQFFGSNYQEQKQLLDSKYRKDGINVFVASYIGADISDDLLSFCVWTKNCHSLLPKTDVVMLDLFGTRYACRWDDLSEVAEDLRVPVDGLYPTRYRVKTYPSEQQLAMIPKIDLTPRT